MMNHDGSKQASAFKETPTRPLRRGLFQKFAELPVEVEDIYSLDWAVGKE